MHPEVSQLHESLMPLSFRSHTGTAGSCTAPVTLAHALLQVRGAWKSRRPVTCLCSATAGVTQVAAVCGPAAWKAHTTQFPQPSEKPIEQSAHRSDVFMPQRSKQPLLGGQGIYVLFVLLATSPNFMVQSSANQLFMEELFLPLSLPLPS